MLHPRVTFAAVVLLLAGCAGTSSAADVPASGPPPTTAAPPATEPGAECAPDYSWCISATSMALPEPTTTVPLTTTTSTTVAPTTTSPPPATTAPPAAPAGELHPAIAASFGTGQLGHQAQAIAQCESQMHAGAVSPTDDHGLFQLNRPTWDKPSAWDGWQQQTGTSWSAVYDPWLNAQFARHVYDHYGWQAWVCRYVL
jgi:hypothetical protein